ncbi:MAG: alanine--glyoxylate aminotransferase family protein [Desulfobacteraceae bacterium]|nr:MAG: alanine--glyoxylate aminotransferase family protein [Desulfobacteraceae bacterium]
MNVNPNEFRDIDPGERILMGPGPSSVPPRVLQTMAAPCVGYLDPYFFSVMDDTQNLLRFVFQTDNALTLPVSGTGSAGMETTIANTVEPGDEVAVCVSGFFGARMCDIVSRVGGKVIQVDGEWGRAIDPDAVRKAVQGRNPKVLAVVHAETSTGACQPIEELKSVARECGALFLVDMVTSLGGMQISLDKMGIDVAYSGSQKCISCPPGLSPVSFSPAAVQALENRKSPVVSFYLDMGMVSRYWGEERKYHHTVPINMIYALREALRILAEEGLEARFARHLLNHRALVAGVEAMGLSMLVPEGERLPMLNAIRIPEGADDVSVRRTLLNDFSIEIGGGLGDLAGKIWRVGLMGHACCRRNVFLFLSALESILWSQGVKTKGGALEAASAVYAEA